MSPTLLLVAVVLGTRSGHELSTAGTTDGVGWLGRVPNRTAYPLYAAELPFRVYSVDGLVPPGLLNVSSHIGGSVDSTRRMSAPSANSVS